MLRSVSCLRGVVERQLPIYLSSRGYKDEYEHVTLKVHFPDDDIHQMKDDTRRRFKDHRTRLQSEWKEEKDQAIDPLLERIKKETTETISAPTLQDVSLLSGVPPEGLKGRQARIFSPARNAMQSGSFATRKWRIMFDNQERWENPNMGWTSSADPLSGLHIEFTTPEDAVAYCQKMGYQYTVEKKRNVPTIKPKSYAANFAWNKNTRVPNK